MLNYEIPSNIPKTNGCWIANTITCNYAQTNYCQIVVVNEMRNE